MQRVPFASLGGILILLSLLFLLPRVRCQTGLSKSIINYLGTDYLLPDGCPEPVCNRNAEDCKRTVDMVRALYSHCLQSQDGQHIGCITDRLIPGQRSSSITIPIYATLCSAMCYEPDPKKIVRIHRCPYPGYRRHDPHLNLLF
eukprot:TRINITY_DN18507_c0_g1_i1.p1 TRINITY_DN18507_c0_g1~~TRINITY_DN18507_c0_g1_i1.p1  ORF type:complete len:144 (-),score=13.34 TRINITY_DN18507_c0_g1_i1:73-504(-)